MNKEQLENYLSNFKVSTSSFPFGPEALVYKVMGKMFALVSQGEKISRVTPLCVTISLSGELSDDMLRDLASESYNLVVSKLAKKEKAALLSL